MTLVFVETEDPTAPTSGGVQLTSAEAVTFARTNAAVLDGGSSGDGAGGGDSGDAAGGGGPGAGGDGGGPGSSPLEVAVIGGLTDQARERLAHLGVDRIHHIESPDLHAYSAAAWAQALVDITPSHGTVMASGTPRGMELMAHAAARLGARMAANVVAADDNGLLRQVLGGAAFERLQLSGAVQVLTIAGHACDPEDTAPTEPEIITHSPDATDADLRTRVVRTEVEEADDTSGLTQAKVVVGAGRGVGSADGFDEVLELVDRLGGALGVSRVVTSLGWRPHAEQVGQTGSRIAPDVYIACGISGAIQHWAGVQGAKTIIAINTDEEAPMVQRADYAIVGDLHEVVAAVNEEIARRKG